MSTEIRDLVDADRRAADALSHEAFGAPRVGADAEPRPFAPGRRRLGAFVAGRLVAKMSVAEHCSFFGSAEVASAGIGGVTVAVESRGAGLLRGLFTEARGEAGSAAPLSTLYPTAPAIYRRFGYEVVTDLVTAAVPTAGLAQLRVPDGVRLRRAEQQDLPAIREVYLAWARGHNGPLTRTGPAFALLDSELLAEHSGITVAERDGAVIGYCSFDRGTGYGPDAAIEVSDLLARCADGYRALLAGLGTHSSVTGRVEIRSSGLDVVRLLQRAADWRVVERHPYMLAVLDVAAAMRQRRWLELQTGFGFAVAGPDQMQGWRLELDGHGSADCTPGPVQGVPVLTRGGLAVRYAGSASCHTLRAAGMLTGPTQNDGLLDALFAGEAHVRDYF